MKQKLLTVANYAKLKGVTTAAVYKWIAQKKVTCKIIDGVKFIVYDNV